MPYALFCNEAKLSKAYPTEADVWKLARQSGLVVDAVSDEEKPAPRPVLDNDYEIRPCQPDPQEDPAQNKADAEREAQLDLQHNSEARVFRCREMTAECDSLDRVYGVATASDACSAASVTQAFRRCSPLIAPVTLSTLPGRTGGVLHEGDLIGSEHQRFGFQDGLGKARQRQPRKKSALTQKHACSLSTSRPNA